MSVFELQRGAGWVVQGGQLSHLLPKNALDQLHKELEKCEKWDWFFWNELPEPKCLPLDNLLKQGFTPGDNHPKTYW